MFLSETHVDVYGQQNESILEAVIAVLESYGEEKTEMMKAESQFLVAQASGALAEAEGGEEAAKEGLKAKAAKVWEKIKAFFQRVLAAVRRGIQQAQSWFGMDKKWLDKNLAAVKAVKSQTMLKAEVVNNDVFGKIIRFLSELRGETKGKDIVAGKKVEWADLSKNLLSIQEISAQKLAAESLKSYNRALIAAKSAGELEKSLKDGEGKAKAVVTGGDAAMSADEMMSYMSFLATMASSSLSVAKRIKNAAMSGMKRAVSAGGDKAEEKKAEPEAKKESAFDLLESEFDALMLQ